MDDIREAYQVPAREGMRLLFDWPAGKPRRGEILRSSEGQYLVVKFGDGGPLQVLHPTWNVTYLDGAR